ICHVEAPFSIGSSRSTLRTTTRASSYENWIPCASYACACRRATRCASSPARTSCPQSQRTTLSAPFITRTMRAEGKKVATFREELGTDARFRVSLLGRLLVDSGGLVVDDDRFPGRQARLVFAYLVFEQARPVPRDELAEVIWGEAPPP